MTNIDRDLIREKFGGRCAYCGTPLERGRRGDNIMQVDHVHARYLGGTDDPDNLVPACRLCNRYKVTYTPEEFRQQLMLIPGRLAAKNMTFRLAQRHGLIVVTDTQPTFLMDGSNDDQRIRTAETTRRVDAMGQPLFAVFVPGVPRPQGSKVNLGRGRMKESSPHLKAWRGLVTTRSAIIWKRNPPIDQPVHLDVVFVMPARKREPDPGGWHTVTPDLDKLIRAIGDALTMAGILHDDSRIAAITATKRRARHNEPPGAHIHLDTLERNPNANKETA